MELGQIYQSAPIGLALLDRNLRYVRINDQLARMHDLAVEDHLGKHVSEVVPHLFPSVEGPLLHVLNTGERVAQIEISGRMSRSLPDEGYWLISLHPLLAAGSSVGGVHVIVQDITERKMAESALTESQALLSALVESTDDMIWSVDPRKFGLLMFNSALKSYFSHELNVDIKIGMAPEDMLPPSFASKWHELYRHALRDGSFVEEYSVCSGRHTLLLAFSLLKRNGETVGISVFGKNITERKRAEENLTERLKFETLLSDLSAEFIDLHADQMDSKIENAQRRVCECLGLDLSSLWQWSVDSPHSLTLTHYYRPLGGPPLPERMNANEHFPWCLEQLKAGKIINISSMDTLPVEAARDRELWLYYGIKTSLTIPLAAGAGPLIGALSFNVMTEERTWPESARETASTCRADFLQLPLARMHSDEILRASEERLTLATEGAGVGLWIMELDTRHVWITSRTREMFQFAPDDGVDLRPLSRRDPC